MLFFMKNLEPSAQLKSFLETDVFKTDQILMRSLNRGGASLNYKISVSDKSFLLKILPLSKIIRAEHLLSVYQNLSTLTNLAAPKISAPTLHHLLNFDEYLLLFMDFIEGKRIKNFSSSELLQFAQNENILFQAHFQQTNFIGSPFTPEGLFEEAQNKFVKITQTSSFLFYKKSIFRILRNIVKNAPQIDRAPCVIHGDTGPNNFILTRSGKLFFLDFEMIRYGQISEDLAQFLLYPLLQHSIWFFNQKKFVQNVRFFNDYFHLNFDDWLYGVSIYFLRLACRRLSSPKILKSPRKSWLFYKHLQKYEKVVQILKTLY